MKITRYEGKQVYMGLDVHREFFVSSCICDGVVRIVNWVFAGGFDSRRVLFSKRKRRDGRLRAGTLGDFFGGGR